MHVRHQHSQAEPRASESRHDAARFRSPLLSLKNNRRGSPSDKMCQTGFQFASSTTCVQPSADSHFRQGHQLLRRRLEGANLPLGFTVDRVPPHTRIPSEPAPDSSFASRRRRQVGRSSPAPNKPKPASRPIVPRRTMCRAVTRQLVGLLPIDTCAPTCRNIETAPNIRRGLRNSAAFP
jgi:hypothetical protein